MIKAIIFDVDGVLVDSRESNVAFYKALFNKAGYKDVSREDILNCFHLPLWNTIQKITALTDENKVKQIFDMAGDSSLRDQSLFKFPEKLEEILEKLHEKYQLAIVTSRIKIGIDDVFDAKQIGHLFDVVVTFEDYANPKPHPEPLLVALRKLKLSADETIYVGDSPSDIEAAKAAGMKSVYLSINQHEHASAIIKKLDELPSAVNNLASN